MSHNSPPSQETWNFLVANAKNFIIKLYMQFLLFPTRLMHSFYLMSHNLLARTLEKIKIKIKNISIKS